MPSKGTRHTKQVMRPHKSWRHTLSAPVCSLLEANCQGRHSRLKHAHNSRSAVLSSSQQEDSCKQMHQPTLHTWPSISPTGRHRRCPLKLRHHGRVQVSSTCATNALYTTRACCACCNFVLQARLKECRTLKQRHGMMHPPLQKALSNTQPGAL